MLRPCVVLVPSHALSAFVMLFQKHLDDVPKSASGYVHVLNLCQCARSDRHEGVGEGSNLQVHPVGQSSGANLSALIGTDLLLQVDTSFTVCITLPTIMVKLQSLAAIFTYYDSLRQPRGSE